jgi:hypothetical protein
MALERIGARDRAMTGFMKQSRIRGIELDRFRRSWLLAATEQVNASAPLAHKTGLSDGAKSGMKRQKPMSRKQIKEQAKEQVSP